MQLCNAERGESESTIRMSKHLPDDREYEPTEEEWREIERLILEEEIEEIKKNREEDKVELVIFIEWCKENGIKW